MEQRDIVIIGGGSAGMSAAVAAFDSGVKDILILERSPYLGGILNQCIHSGFGLEHFKEGLTGPEFLTRYVHEVEKRGIEYVLDANVVSIDEEKVVSYICPQGSISIKAKAIIMATGCYERSAGAIGIPGTRPSGIVSAGLAQYYLNQFGYLVGKRVFILGSGDIGLIMARRMTLEGAKVLGVAELMPYSNGLNRNIQQCLKDFDIPLYLSHTVTNCYGSSRLEGIELSEVDKTTLKPIPGTGVRYDCDTLLLSIGLIPNNDLLDKLGVPASKTRGAFVDDRLETAKEGIFSCGNCLHVHDLVDYVVAEGEVAGKSAAKYVQGLLEAGEKSVFTLPGDNIGYIVPAKIDLTDKTDKFTVKFRVRSPRKDVYVVYRQLGKVLRRVYKTAIIPSEMEIATFNKSQLEDSGEFIIEIVDKEAR